MLHQILRSPSWLPFLGRLQPPPPPPPPPLFRPGPSSCELSSSLSSAPSASLPGDGRGGEGRGGKGREGKGRGWEGRGGEGRGGEGEFFCNITPHFSRLPWRNVLELDNCPGGSHTNPTIYHIKHVLNLSLVLVTRAGERMLSAVEWWW